MAVQRFRSGLQDKAMAAHIMMMCRGNRQTLNDAFEMASSWEATMKHCLRENEDTTQIQAGALFGMYGMTIAPLEKGAKAQNARPKIVAVASELLSDLATKVKEHELGIPELKAAQTLTNDNLTGLRSNVQGIARTMNQGFGLSTNPQYSGPFPNAQYSNPQYPRPHQPGFQPRGILTRPQYGAPMRDIPRRF
jgi:hypothetical protein